ncbi:MAG TPA: hypothetical protein VLI46_04890 [Ramlibacter sp.]|nr:hypothetical protein [Ramlibacter sp.]
MQNGGFIQARGPAHWSAFALAASVCLGVLLAAPAALAQRMYKCGANYQDRPCAEESVQQRFSHASGSFSIGQVNPDTDKDCARVAGEALPLWQRMHNGESLAKLKAEVDGRPISRYEKSQLRDVLIALREYRGTPQQVRSQLETQCMNYKRAHGMPTEREVAGGALERMESPSSGADSRSYAHERRAQVAQMRAAAAAERAARAAEAAAMRR